MELESLKKAWDQMTEKLNQQQHLTNQIISDMTKEQYHLRVNRIGQYELIGSIICFVIGMYLVTQFHQLSNWYLQVCGAFTVLFLFGAPIVSLFLIYQMKKLNFDNLNIQQTIAIFEERKNRFLLAQQWIIYGCFLLILTSLPVATKILRQRDIFENPGILYWYLPLATAGLFFFTKWVYACYVKIMRSAADVIQSNEKVS